MNRFAALALFTVPLVAQIPDLQKTLGILNCRYWNNQNDTERLNFIIGFYESYKLFSNPAKESSLIFESASFGDVVKGTTEVCEKPENARLWIPQAIAAFREKMNGASQAQIDAYLESSRKITSAAAK